MVADLMGSAYMYRLSIVQAGQGDARRHQQTLGKHGRRGRFARSIHWRAFAPSDRIRWTQCQAQLLGQFSVWVPPLTLTKHLTPGLRARAGHTSPAGLVCPARAEKCGWCCPSALSKIEVGWTAVIERLMRSLGVVEREI